MTSNYIVLYSPCHTSAGLVAEIAKLSHCEIKHCSTTEQTIDVSLATQPSLIIILCITPIINGEGFIPRLRTAIKQRPTIFVIAWHQSEQAILNLLEAGVDQYMTFPLCMQRLYSKICSLVNVAKQ